MKKQKIAVVVGDMGSVQYITPILPQLMKNYSVQLYVDSEGAGSVELKRTATYPYVETDGHTLDFLGTGLVVCGNSAKAAGLWRAATLAAQAEGVPVVWLGDFYGSLLEPQVGDLSPMWAATFDPDTREQFLCARPQFAPEHVEVVSNPVFDPIASFNLSAMRAHTRLSLGIPASESFVLYSASSFHDFDLEESIGALLPWAKSRGCRFAIRFHPADQRSDPERITRIRARFGRELGRRMVDTSALSSGIELAAGADLFTTDYSTEGVKAVLAGIPTAFLMLESAQAFLRTRKGGKLPFFSVLKDEPGSPAPAIGIWSLADVTNLDVGFNPAHQGLVATALRHPRFRVLADGTAGERVLAFIKKLMP